MKRTDRRKSRTIRAAVLTLAVMTAFAASALPACADGSCCAIGGEPTVQRQMPCCAEPSVTSREAFHSLPATSAGSASSAQQGSPMALAEESRPADAAPPRIPLTLAHASPAPHQPRPPLFLLNAQFLI